MKNSETWKPTKFIRVNGRLRASRNAKNLAVSSRLNSNLIASFYDTYVPKYVKGNLIDLGCGKVPLYETYKPYVRSVICVDRPNPESDNPYIDRAQDLNKTLDFADGAFDTIILSDVLEHMRNPGLLMDEMFRILSVKGHVLLNVPFLYWIHEGPYDYFRYTEFALKSMAESSGFTVVLLTPYGGAPEVLADMQAKLLCHIPLLGKSTAVLIQKLTWLFIKTRPGRKFSARSSKLFPLGYFMILKKP